MNQYGSDEFDDPELSRSLGRMSGAFPDAGAALGQVQSRVKRVRQRRGAAWSSGALVAVVAVAVFALNAQRPGGTQRPASSADLVTSSLPDDGPTSSSAVSSAVSSSTSTVTTLVETTIAVITTPVSVEDSALQSGDGDNGEPGAVPGPVSVTPTTTKPRPRPPVSTSPGPAPTSSNPGHSNPGSSNPGPSTTEPDDDEGDEGEDSFTPATQTFSGIGGSITVSMDSLGHLRMLSYSANAGYSADDIRNGEQRVSIRFRNGNFTTRIRVEVGGGTMVPQIIEES